MSTEREVLVPEALDRHSRLVQGGWRHSLVARRAWWRSTERRPPRKGKPFEALEHDNHDAAPPQALSHLVDERQNP